MPESRAVRPISQKQLDYLPVLRKRLLKVYGSQTPPEFMDASGDRALSVITASVLIGQMKKMLSEGTPPVREESTVEPSNSEGSGYEEGPDPEVAEAPPVFIKIWQAPLPDPGPTEYWGWDWLCTHPDHGKGVGAARVDRQEAAFADALMHWGKYHLPED